MRALRLLIPLAALLMIAGAASAQNAPCPECDEDGAGDSRNSYHGLDVGVIESNSTEILGDTDMAHSHDDDERGFWLWLELCLSAFLQHVEHAIGVETDVDANAEVYANSNGADLDASVAGLTQVCAAVDTTMTCDWDFDQSDAGDVDSMTWEAMAEVEAATGTDVFVPAVLPDTSDTSTEICVYADLQIVSCS